MDLVLLHPPTVYDFRKMSIFYGPVSDLIPSTPIFEMYPMGFTTIATQLHSEGYRVRIANLASMMLNDPGFSAERFISRLDSDVIGIDLHWLPHVHGALEVARLVKKRHPETKVLMGGYSASYYHEELITYPQVDMVMRGDSTEIPVLRLMEALEHDRDLETVPNLTWKEGDKTRVNPLSFVPDDLDYLKIDYGWLVKSVMRFRDLEGFKPWRDWDRYPLTAVIPVRGCPLDCAVCGGSCFAMRRVLGRRRPAYRSPEMVARDVLHIQHYLKSPTFMVGDLRLAGRRWAERFLREAKELGVENHLVLELQSPAGEDYFRLLSDHLEGFSIEMSPDSHDIEVRRPLGRDFPTDAMERSVLKALKGGCDRFDLFFMIGLPHQNRESALDSARYAAHLYSLADDDERLRVYISPLAPFLDPGSRVFEMPEEFGYRSLARSLEEHRLRLTSPSWKHALSYETEWMTRDQIAETSYDAGDLLAEVSFEHGKITMDELRERRRRTDAARRLMSEIDLILTIDDAAERQGRLSELREIGLRLMDSTICQKRDLEWSTRGIMSNAPRVLLGLIRGRGER